MRRILSLWLPFWPTERLSRAGLGCDAPLVLIASQQGGQRLVSVDRAAADEGLFPGMLLADARALVPHLKSRPAEPAADAQALIRLAEWLTRYTPWVGLDGADGLVLDVSGGAHLFGGEDRLMRDVIDRLGALGVTCRAALAPSTAAAAALARFGPSGCRIDDDLIALKKAIGGLPVAALRLDSALAENWRQLGLAAIEQLAALPRAALARRYGADVIRRLDEIHGHSAPPIAPLNPAPHYHMRLVCPEPIMENAAILMSLTRLSQALKHELARDSKGARKLEARLYRVDGHVEILRVGLARASRDGDHFIRLLAEKLRHAHCDLDAGFGYDAVALLAAVTEDLNPVQSDLKPASPRGGLKTHGVDDLGTLVDRLGNRLGLERIGRMAPRESHVPEAAVAFKSFAANAFAETRQSYDWRADERMERPRPLRMLGAPEPIDVVAEVPDGPPARFRWRRVDYQVALAEGPERIAPEWWLKPLDEQNSPTRDYFRVEDAQGRRFWLYRDGLYGETERPPRWYMHGVFA